MQVLGLIAVVVLFLGGTEARHSEGVPCAHGLCRCYPRENKAECDGHGHKLTYIPSLPEYVTGLDFSNNYLPEISQQTFQNLSSLHLKDLNITYCSASRITPDAFSQQNHLKSLSLNGNKIFSRVLVELFPSFTNLRLLHLSLENLHLPTSDFFHNFSTKSLQTLILARNKITTYNQSHFGQITNLEILSLSHNYIQAVHLDHSFSLSTLSLRDNVITQFPTFCDKETFFPNLGEIKLDHNSLHVIDGQNLKCMQRLKVFSINGNHILRIRQNTFSDLPLLRFLILRNLQGDIHIDKYAFNNSNVQYISLTGDNMHFKSDVHKDAFRGCSSLQSLDASFNVFFNTTNQDLDDWFGHLTTLTGLGLGNCGIKQYPTFIPIKLKRLKYLKLYGNNMDELPIGAFEPLKELTHLWLTNNRFAKLDARVFPPSVRKRLQVISLMHNPFACNCELLWFLKWTKSDSRKFQKYPAKYVCDSPENMKGRVLSKVDLTEYKCLISLSVSLTIIGSTSGFLLILVAASLTYRWRWHIRYYLHMRKVNNGNVRLMPQNDMLFDSYVVYSQKDIKWIKGQLIPHVEGELGKQLYIRDRDSMPGLPIVDNVVNNMAASRSVLVVLSKAMARDEECQFELMFVQRQEEGQRSPIILVLLEEVQAVTQSVYALVNMHSYISWGDERDAQELFWDRLHQALDSIGRNVDI